MTEVRIRRFSVGTILKVCLFVTIPSSAVGLLFGLFALLGFNTVRWGALSVLGGNGLLLGVAMGLVAGIAVGIVNFLLIWMGMTVVSAFKTTRIQFQERSGTPRSSVSTPQDL